ncbi:MAG: sulfotransferase family protein [Gemmatimonadales bacterium]
MLPNFLVIGAAKAGTTSLHWYLAEHPDVFMTPVKDPSFFAYGVDERGQLLWGDPQRHVFPIRSLREYEGLFAETRNATAVGEASTMYLECPQAAGRIQALLPAVRILCSLRHPVDRAYSDYLMHLRRRGLRFDPARELTATAEWAQPESRWMQIGMYYQQLKRYYDAFPRDRIQVVLFEDLRQNPREFVTQVYRFLDVDPSFDPDFETPHAPGGIPVSSTLEALFLRGARSSAKTWVPKRAANWLRRLRARTMRQAPRMPGPLRRELTERLRDDITATSALIGRSLQHWL